MAESEEKLKTSWWRWKRRVKKSGLKLNFQKTKIMALGPITSWQIDGEMMETMINFIFLGSKITVDGDCSHEIKRRLLLGRKAMTNLHSILKSRDITLLTNVCIVKAVVFPVVIYGCESLTVKKAECRRTEAFELWCWRRLLTVSGTARKSIQSILKEISPEYSLEGLMLKLKLQMQRAGSLKKTLMLGKIKSRRRKGRQRKRWLDGIINSMVMSLSKFWKNDEGQGRVGYCSPWGRKESDTTEQLNNNNKITEIYWLIVLVLEIKNQGVSRIGCFLKKIVFIYLAVLDLNWHMWDLSLQGVVLVVSPQRVGS